MRTMRTDKGKYKKISQMTEAEKKNVLYIQGRMKVQLFYSKRKVYIETKDKDNNIGWLHVAILLDHINQRLLFSCKQVQSSNWINLLQSTTMKIFLYTFYTQFVK